MYGPELEQVVFIKVWRQGDTEHKLRRGRGGEEGGLVGSILSLPLKCLLAIVYSNIMVCREKSLTLIICA